MSVKQLSNEEILKQLEELPRERRIELANGLLAGVQTAREHRATQPLRNLLGIANPEGKTFTDEELDHMVEEERMRRLLG